MDTKWKRCSKCKDLKYINEFWKQGSYYRSWCKDCIKESVDKNKKKEYDKERYKKKKFESIENKIDYICMRCEKKYANVRNNQLYWCFDCLDKYETENKQKIKVEIIDIRRRSFSLKWDEYKNNIINEKTIEGYLYDFVNNLENKGIIDINSKNKILEKSNLDNKEEVIKRLINDIEIFKDYEENTDNLLVEFPYKKYLEELKGK